MMEKNVLEFLETAAELYYDKIAVKDICGQCSFAELKYSSQKIGSGLCTYKISNKVIPVYMEKGIMTLEVFLGIVYAGGAYSLLNPLQPVKRLETIMNMLDAPVVITDRTHLDKLRDMKHKGAILLAEDLLNEDICETELADIRCKMTNSEPLYVNFTSGSTGTPKGVAVGHGSVIEFIHYFVEIFHLTCEDIIGNQAPFDFDVSVKDIYSMLVTGATLYIIPKEAFSFPQKLLDIIEDEKITTLIWAVSALCQITSLRGFTYKIPTSVNKVLFSGEVMPPTHLEEWRKALPDAMFVNLYGPTEVTCNCTYYILPKEWNGKDTLPIGKAFPNEKVFLLNDKQEEVGSPDVEGEICVAGSTLALGYYGDKEKTEKVFKQNPLNNKYHEMIYCTGDLGKYREDGNLVYTGRKDFQIKHMGHRIELLEIDAHIGQISGIERVCCLYDEKEKEIIAFYQGNVEKAMIKRELKQCVFKYMIPGKFVQITQMPLTNNGKIDRKKLRKDYLEGEIYANASITETM